MIFLAADQNYALDVETDIVTRETRLKLFVVHFDGLHLSGHVGGSEGDNHAGFNDTSLDTTNRYCSNTTNFVNILERKSERLVGRTSGRFDGIDSIKKGLPLGYTTLNFLGPALEPCHTIDVLDRNVQVERKTGTYLLDSSNMLSPCQPEIGTNATALGL